MYKTILIYMYNWLTSWSRDLLVKLTVTQLVNKFVSFLWELKFHCHVPKSLWLNSILASWLQSNSYFVPFKVSAHISYLCVPLKNFCLATLDCSKFDMDLLSLLLVLLELPVSSPSFDCCNKIWQCFSVCCFPHLVPSCFLDHPQKFVVQS